MTSCISCSKAQKHPVNKPKKSKVFKLAPKQKHGAPPTPRGSGSGVSGGTGSAATLPPHSSSPGSAAYERYEPRPSSDNVTTAGPAKQLKGKKLGRGRAGSKLEMKGHINEAQMTSPNDAGKSSMFYDAPPVKPVFGVPLDIAVRRSKSHDGIPVPAIVRQCIDYVNDQGLSLEGIYRVSANEMAVKELRQSVDYHVKKIVFPDAHCAASLLKRFFRELPESIVTDELKPKFEKIAIDRSKSKEEVLKSLQVLLDKLPPCNYYTLAYLLIHMSQVMQRSSENKMTLPNLGLILWNTLDMDQALLNIFLGSALTLFPGLKIKCYVSPLSPKPDRQSIELPSSPEAIEEELKKQESLLAQLHEEVSQGTTDASIDKQLWDVQAIVTQLRRKLKQLKAMTVPPAETNIPIKEPESTDDSGPCYEMFEEKQLLAVQVQLKELINKEQEAVDELRRKIQRAKAAKLQQLQQQQQQQMSTEMTVPISNGHVAQAAVANGTPAGDNKIDADIEPDELTREQWEEKALALESRRDELVQKIVDERQKCAELQAKIEMVNLTRQSRVIEATRL